MNTPTAFQLIVRDAAPDNLDHDDWIDAATTPNPVFGTLNAAKQYALGLSNEERATQDRDNAADIASDDLIALGQLNRLDWEQLREGNYDLWVAVDADTSAHYSIYELPLN